jgi:diacylglycerol kinase (ATP)
VGKLRNRPKYHLFKNAKYAVDGLIESLLNETSFKLEVILFIFFSIIIWFLLISLLSKTIMQTAMLIPLIAELLNSAIERTVDLVTKEFHPLAKYAKDVGAAAVLLSLFLTLGIWNIVLIYEFF